MLKLNSVKTRLILWMFLILAIATVLAYWIIFNSFRSGITESLDSALYLIAEEVEHSILKYSPEVWKEEIQNVRNDFLSTRYFIQLAERDDISGKIEYLSGSEVLSRSRFPESREGVFQTLGEGPEYLDIVFKGNKSLNLRLILLPVQKRKNKSLIIMVATPTKRIGQYLERLQNIMMVLGPFFLLVTLLGGYMIVSVFVNPLRNVTRVLTTIEAQDLSMRIPERKRNDEISELIRTLNKMIERLEDSVNQIRQFSGDVSHELRTPLTIIRGETELSLRRKRDPESYRKTIRIVHRAVSGLESVVKSLLLLSQLEFEGSGIEFSEIFLPEIIMTAVKETEKRAKQKKVRIVLGKIDPVAVSGSEPPLRSMMVNLLGNAVKYTPAGGEIHLALHGRGETTEFRISDTGTGIPKDEVEKVFDRFYRCESQQHRDVAGSGLGLSIVKQVALLHGGSVRLESEEGKGTTVIITLPALGQDTGPQPE